MSAKAHTPSDSDSEDWKLAFNQPSRLGDQEKESSKSDNMLSINFSTPLAGAARAERIKQMTNNHAAFIKARASQEILVKIQTSLRRMPGVSARESDVVISQLQEVGQIISQETGQLVDALMNLTLDQDDTDKAIARMSIETNLIKAQNEDQAQSLITLGEELKQERLNTKKAMGEVAKVMDDLQKLAEEYKALKAKQGVVEQQPSTDRDEMIKHLEKIIQHLEDQVQNRRSLWAMRHADVHSICRAIETLADSCEDREAVRQSLQSMAATEALDDGLHEPRDPSHTFSEMAPAPARPSTAFQAARGPSVTPSRYASLGSGAPRASSSLQHDRRYQAPWGAGSPQPRPSYHGNGPFASPSYGRAPSRRGFHPGSAYRPNAPEFYPSGFHKNDPFTPQKDHLPMTPSNGRNTYGRLPDQLSPAYDGSRSTALARRAPIVGPLIHLTDVIVAAWREQIEDLYSVIREFVDRNANEPTFRPVEELRQTEVWSTLLATYAPLSEAASMSYLDYHLKEVSSKSCLVVRVLVDYVVNRVLIPRAWIGLNDDTSCQLMEIERQLVETSGKPASFRQPILDRQAHVIDTILKMDTFCQFAKMKQESITESLFEKIRPLLNERAHLEAVYQDLEIVAARAWSLSSKVLSSRLTFDFKFPGVGSRFEKQSMVPIWPLMDPVELQAKHWRVALVTTPVITCRNDTGYNIEAFSVTLADVVCMQ